MLAVDVALGLEKRVLRSSSPLGSPHGKRERETEVFNYAKDHV